MKLSVFAIVIDSNKRENTNSLMGICCHVIEDAKLLQNSSGHSHCFLVKQAFRANLMPNACWIETQNFHGNTNKSIQLKPNLMKWK